jgi:hypothetical protein
MSGSIATGLHLALTGVASVLGTHTQPVASKGTTSMMPMDGDPTSSMKGHLERGSRQSTDQVKVECPPTFHPPKVSRRCSSAEPKPNFAVPAESDWGCSSSAKVRSKTGPAADVAAFITSTMTPYQGTHPCITSRAAIRLEIAEMVLLSEAVFLKDLQSIIKVRLES